MFSALQEIGEGYSVICCLEVSNITPLDLKAITTKYRKDEYFVKQLVSVKGAPFMYEAHPVAKKDWSELLTTLANNDANPDDISPFSEPVISGVFHKENTPRRFEMNGTKIKLRDTIDRKRDTITYYFSIGERTVKLSGYIELGD